MAQQLVTSNAHQAAESIQLRTEAHLQGMRCHQFPEVAHFAGTLQQLQKLSEYLPWLYWNADKQAHLPVKHNR
jgi:hypothetical protein